MRPLHHPATADIELTSVLYALADPVRLSLVRGLSRDKPVSCIRVSEEKQLALPRCFQPQASAIFITPSY